MGEVCLIIKKAYKNKKKDENVTLIESKFEKTFENGIKNNSE